MARPLRIEFDGAWYHVLNRGLARRNIVRTDKDRKLFFDILGETATTYGIEVHAYSLLNNHYHLLIHTPTAGLSRAMRHLNGVYTQKVNKGWRSDGPIYRGRYKAILVDSNEYLLELVRYIHLNPVKAGLCAHPKEHPWTSHVAYLKKPKRPQWLVTGDVLNHFGGKESKSIIELNDFVCSAVSKEFSSKLKKERVILGSKGFSEWVHKNFVDRTRKGIPLQERVPRKKIPVGHILQCISHVYDIPIKEIRSAQSGQRNEARSMAVYLIRRLSECSQSEIAKWLKASNQNAVAQMQYRFHQRLTKEKQLNKRINIVTHSILTTVKP
jgi:REP element-mobilizing transposase RayT